MEDEQILHALPYLEWPLIYALFASSSPCIPVSGCIPTNTISKCKKNKANNSKRGQMIMTEQGRCEKCSIYLSHRERKAEHNFFADLINKQIDRIILKRSYLRVPGVDM